VQGHGFEVVAFALEPDVVFDAGFDADLVGRACAVEVEVVD
jgi:hypothetical protein